MEFILITYQNNLPIDYSDMNDFGSPRTHS